MSSKTTYKNIIYYSAVVAAIIVGAVLRLWNLGDESIRLDEAQGIWQAMHSVEYIKWYMVQNVHLPFHNILLHTWIKLFGHYEATVRLLAAIPGILSLPAILLLAQEMLKSRKAAFLVLLLASLSPFWIWYSREIRMYTLLTLVTTLSYFFYLRSIRYVRLSDFLFYTVLNTIGIYTHYFFNFVLLVQAIFFFVAWRSGWYPSLVQHGKRLLKYFTLSAVAAFLLYLPWGIYFYINHSRGGSFAPVLEEPDSFNLVLSFFEFTLGYQPESLTASLIALWPIAVLISFIFLTKRRNPIIPPVYLAFIGTVLPITIVYLFSRLITPIYLTRYLISTTPLFLILLIWLLTELKGSIKYASIGLFFAIVMLALYNQKSSNDIPFNENYREAVNYVNQNVNIRDIVVVSPPYTLYPVYYYYNSEARLLSMPLWDKTQLRLPEINDEVLRRDSTFIQQGHRRIFLISTLDLQGAFDVQRYLDTHYTKLDKKQFSKFIWVEVYQAEYPPEPAIQIASSQ